MLYNKSNRVLITGGAGFLGINLVRFLLERGFQVRILDLAPFDYPDVRDQVEIIKGDIRDQKMVDQAIVGVNFVIHTAAALPLYSKQDIFSTDIEGTKIMAKMALKHRVKRLIHISSTAVYGIPDHHPLYETDQLSGVGPYGIAKIEAEKICEKLRDQGLDVAIIRPKSFVGPERLGAFALLFDWAKSGKNFPILGNGKNRYQLLDVEDLCQAIYLTLTLPSKKVNDTFNIGAEKFATMAEDYQTVLDYAGFGKKVIPVPTTPVILALRFLEFLHLSPLYKWIYETAATDSYVAIEKAKKQLDFKPKYSNQQALIRNYEWYLKNLNKIEKSSGISHRVPWKQGALALFKVFF